MRRHFILVFVAALAACSSAPPPAPPPRALRIVSLDYCADQYVLRLVARDRIVAVSRDARKPFSYMRAAAAGVPQVAARAEDVLVLRPDLVVRSYGGGVGAAALFARAGVPVLQLGSASDIAGVRATLQTTADRLGEGARGAALDAQIARRLAVLPRAPGTSSALYMTPGGVTTGAGGLIDAMLGLAGYRNFATRAGWQPLPLERLAYRHPDMVAAASFTRHQRPDAWSAARHPVAQAQLRDRRVVDIDGALTACGGWFVLDAVEALAQARAS